MEPHEPTGVCAQGARTARLVHDPHGVGGQAGCRVSRQLLAAAARGVDHGGQGRAHLRRVRGYMQNFFVYKFRVEMY